MKRRSSDNIYGTWSNIMNNYFLALPRFARSCCFLVAVAFFVANTFPTS